MSDIVPFGGGGQDLVRASRSTKKALEAVRGHGLVAAAKIDAAAYASNVALQEMGALSLMEASVAQQCPHAAGRAKAIVDNFTVVAANTIARMGR